MNHNTRTVLVSFLLMLALTACSIPPKPATAQPEVVPTAAGTGVFVLGKISKEPVGEIKENQPIADCVAASLGEFGIGRGEVKVAEDVEGMAALIASGEVHIFFDNAFSAAQVMAISNGKPIALRIKDGPATKRGIFFALPGSGLTSLDDLKGHVIALQDPTDIVGYLGAKVLMMDAGLNPVEVESLESHVEQDQVGYIFSGNPENTLEWVLSGKVIAGAVEEDDYKEATEKNPDIFVIIGETEALTRHQPGLAPGNINPALADAIVNSLVNLANTCPEALSPSETLEFIPYSGDGKAAVERVLEMFQLIQDE
ncbi:MAG: hypothetical protein DPW18_09435 [Chloroflexi bacterium]|nr:hypothetical protein [Chloroflexota bacterium]MDL1943507.1 phosphate/phosphite/phosphonate ABC transporter substrate-binding protein [Chloroflexi bacterium CFX2]